MTDYNDGKWHGWNNSADCPVHENSRVVMVTAEGIKTERAACEIDWNGSRHPLFAFRVTKEHKEPREFWVVDGCAYDDPQVGYSCIHVREVLE